MEHPLRAYRRNANLSLDDFAKSIGVTKSFLSKLENGKQRPSLRTIEKIAESTGGAVGAEDFFCRVKASFPVFEKLGGDAAALEALKNGSMRDSWPTRAALKGWRTNGLPDVVIKRLIEICDGRGIPYCARDFDYVEDNKSSGAAA